jgi:hypothetical protein
LNQRIINEAQTATAAFIHGISLKEAIRSAKKIETNILEGLKIRLQLVCLALKF